MTSAETASTSRIRQTNSSSTCPEAARRPRAVPSSLFACDVTLLLTSGLRGGLTLLGKPGWVKRAGRRHYNSRPKSQTKRRAPSSLTAPAARASIAAHFSSYINKDRERGLGQAMKVLVIGSGGR